LKFNILIHLRLYKKIIDYTVEKDISVTKTLSHQMTEYEL